MSTEASFAVGNQVGEIARRIYDPSGVGSLIDLKKEGFEAAFARSSELLHKGRPIFEAGFRMEGALAFADLLLPIRRSGQRAWRMIEVKSSSSVKAYHRDDIAVQAHVARSAGLPLASVSLAHVDTEWIYPGGSDYQGLLKETDVTEETLSRSAEVQSWIDGAQRIVAQGAAPDIALGEHCTAPYDCGFIDHCRSQQPQAEHPIEWLPRRSKVLKKHLADHGLSEMVDVPNELLDVRQLRVKKATLSGKAFFDRRGAAAALADFSLPAYFLDFETISYTVPIWKGTRPYQQIPFQFSTHRLSRTGKLEQRGFLDLSGNNPAKACAEALIDALHERGPIYVYSGFERAKINDLAARFPRLRSKLLALTERLVDLQIVAAKHYYHPSQKGSWSIKAVLPALCNDLRYDALDGVQNGGMAMEAYAKAIAPDTTLAHKARLERQLLAYCELDTYAMVRLWSAFTAKPILS